MEDNEGFTVTRQKLYQRTGRFSWRWMYTITLPDGTTAEAGSQSEVKGIIEAWRQSHDYTPSSDLDESPCAFCRVRPGEHVPPRNIRETYNHYIAHGRL